MTLDGITLIGIGTFQRSGKDTAASFLTGDIGFERLSFADPVREALRTLDPVVGWDEEKRKVVRWAELYDACGYEEAKDHPVYGKEFRRVMIFLGTNVAREQWKGTFWVDLLVEKMRARREATGQSAFVIPDMRFPNEAEWVRSVGGTTVQVNRAGIGATQHEPGIPDHLIDYQIENDSTIEALGEKIVAVARDLGVGA